MVDAGLDFYCDDNLLTDLAGAPHSVQGGFNCSRNKLVSLKGAPQHCADFDCSHNALKSLEGGPRQVTHLYSDNTLLTSLEHGPDLFAEMQTPFGTFLKWSEVPEDLRLSPETRRRLIEEAEAPIRAMEAAVRGATILDAPLTVGRALKFKR
jgi:hypothetical protein